MITLTTKQFHDAFFRPPHRDVAAKKGDHMICRRQLLASSPWVIASPMMLSGCSPEPAADSYEVVAVDTWRHGT